MPSLSWPSVTYPSGWSWWCSRGTHSVCCASPSCRCSKRLCRMYAVWVGRLLTATTEESIVSATPGGAAAGSGGWCAHREPIAAHNESLASTISTALRDTLQGRRKGTQPSHHRSCTWLPSLTTSRTRCSRRNWCRVSHSDKRVRH